MKKLVAIGLTAFLTFGLVACGGGSGSSSAASSSAAASSAASSEAEAPAASSSEAEAPAASSSSSEAEAPAAADNGEIAISVILKTTTSEYWSYFQAGVEQAFEDYGLSSDSHCIGPQSETSYDEQISMIETDLSSGKFDAICLAPLQPESVENSLGGATIPVVIFDSDAPCSTKKAYVGCGNENAAYEEMSYALEQVPDAKNVVLIAGVQGNDSSTTRENGVKRALEEKGLEPVAYQYADWVSDKAATTMENILASTPDIDIVFCCNDDMAAGAAKAIESAGKTDEIFLCGFDGIGSGVQLVIDGKSQVTVAQEPYNVGYVTVETALALAKGETVEENIDTGARLITPDIAEEYKATLEGYLS